MKHARNDYAPIQDPREEIPPDEPVFLLRGQDETAADAVEFWAKLNEERYGSTRITRLARDHAKLMRNWPKKKVADLPTTA